MKHRVSVIICAAGKGERAAFGKNKLLVPVYGAPVLYHTIKKFTIPEVDEVIVTSSKFDLKEISAVAAPLGCKIVLGGQTRTESVKKALSAVTGDIVLIHDGARPFVTKEAIIRCIESVKVYGNGVCAVKATDTAVYGHYGLVHERLDRENLYLIQTPQGFLTDEISTAYARAGDNVYTDDSAVYGEYFCAPRLIEGDYSNVKLTYREDFLRVFPHGVACEGNFTGLGVDVHAFGDGNFVTLAGEKIPCGNGLIAHSDGDVVIHSVVDALLSAAGLKDIGHYFPDTDIRYKDADSTLLLQEVVRLIHQKGFEIGNVSISVQAEKPKLAPHIEKMKNNLSVYTEVPADKIAIAAGTCEGLGFVGEGLGIASYCTVTLNNRG